MSVQVNGCERLVLLVGGGVVKGRFGRKRGGVLRRFRMRPVVMARVARRFLAFDCLFLLVAAAALMDPETFLSSRSH